MGIDVVAFIFGAILLATGLWGGGVTVKDLSVPQIGPVPRAASIGLGIFIILMGIGLNEISSEFSDGTVSSSSPLPSPVPQDPLPSEIDSTSDAGFSEQINDPDQEFRAQVGQQLILMSEQVGLEGYVLTHEPYLGQLEDNTQERITLELQGGVNYGIIGVCDRDCGDIDLELYDENGNLIDSDTLTDDIPIVEVTPNWDGPFILSIGMSSCAAPYCYYGIGTFGI
jgi:hypothetical protein